MAAFATQSVPSRFGKLCIRRRMFEPDDPCGVAGRARSRLAWMRARCRRRGSSSRACSPRGRAARAPRARWRRDDPARRRKCPTASPGCATQTRTRKGREMARSPADEALAARKGGERGWKG
eukprot:5365021-Pleurochrysis_carterae.AAC.2